MSDWRLEWIVVCIATVVTLACSREEPAITFRYANEQPESANRSQSMLFFESELEKRTGGRIQVELYFGGVLGDERELMDLVATGALQGTRGAFFADANPKFNLLTLPFLVDDWDQAMRLMTSEFTQAMNRGARAHGFHVPATGISQGFRAHTNNVRPITHPKDLRGLKMRVPMQEVYVRTALAFEANPQEMPSIEIYQALQTGVVDGQDNPPSNIWDFRIHEVSNYLTVTNYATGPDPLMVNLAWYERLSVDLQATFDEVARETMALSDRLNRETEADYIRRLARHLEVNYVTGPDLVPFRQSVQPVYEAMVAKGDFTEEDIRAARTFARGIATDHSE